MVILEYNLFLFSFQDNFDFQPGGSFQEPTEIFSTSGQDNTQIQIEILWEVWAQN